MRPIKFRAWEKEFKKMLCPVWLTRSGMEFGENGWSHNILSHQFEIMQFTGLFDRNGKEIWEGDIVRYIAKTANITVDLMVVFNEKEGAFQQAASDRQTDTWFDWEELEVIGNVVDNPGLLEGKNG